MIFKSFYEWFIFPSFLLLCGENEGNIIFVQFLFSFNSISFPL